MQQRTSRKLNKDFAADFGLAPEMRIGSGSERGFGHGYTIGAATFFALLVASFVNLYFSRDDQVRLVRGVGYLLIVFGGSFIFVIIYQIVQRIGVPWSVTFGSRFAKQGTLERRKDPIFYWLTNVAALALFAGMLAFGIWLCIRAPWVAAHLN